MRDMLAVELVENVLVDVLGVPAEEVLPYACVVQDLGANQCDILVILRRLRGVLPEDAVERLTADGRDRLGDALTVEELVDHVERGTQRDRGRLRRALLAQAQRGTLICEPRTAGDASPWVRGPHASRDEQGPAKYSSASRHSNGATSVPAMAEDRPG
jgi:hypothetical protein